MIKLSRMACYGVVLLSELAETESRLSTTEICESTGLSKHMAAKILKTLANDGIIDSSIGSAGGYVLAKSPDDISIADVVNSLDGPVSLTGCVDGKEDECQLQGYCSLQGCWDAINMAVIKALDDVKLSSVLARKQYYIQG
jgi:FeS assembly SUF system regulator